MQKYANNAFPAQWHIVDRRRRRRQATVVTTFFIALNFDFFLLFSFFGECQWTNEKKRI